MEVTEKSKSTYHSLSYWDRLPTPQVTRHVVATENVAE